MTETLPAAPTLGTMSSSVEDRNLQVIDVPAGAAAVEALWEPLGAALEGRSCIAPVPAVSAATPQAVAAAIRSSLRVDQPVDDVCAVVMATSGSTGKPRGVELSSAALTCLSDHINARAGAPPAWVLAIPATSMGGLNVLVRARAAGLAPVPVRSIGGHEPFTDEAFAEAVNTACRFDRPIAVSLVPAQLPRLLATDTGRNALTRCSLVLVGGAAVPEEIRNTCVDIGVPLSLTYGMTETSGGCVIDGFPLPGVRIRIDDTDDRIQITGPMLARGYRDGRNEAFQDGWLRTNDRGIWNAERLTVLGRLDDIVTVNGVNVDLIAVENRLREHPFVDDAIAVARPDPVRGSRIHAICIGRVPDLATVRNWVAQSLGKEAAPSEVHSVEAFAVTASGKVDRRVTAANAGIAPTPTPKAGM